MDISLLQNLVVLLLWCFRLWGTKQTSWSRASWDGTRSILLPIYPGQPHIIGIGRKKENIHPLVITSLFTIFPGASGPLVTMGPSYLQTRAISAQCSKLPSTGLHHAKCSLGGRQKCQLASRSMIHSWNFRTLKKTYNAEWIAVCLWNLCVLVLANFI